MGWLRPRHVVLAASAAVVLLVGTGTASGRTVPVPRAGVVHGSVTAEGVAVGPPGYWHVGHPRRGAYRVTVPGDRVALDVTSWDAVADVTVLPLGGDTVEVRFDSGRRPVDTPFRFVTVPRR